MAARHSNATLTNRLFRFIVGILKIIWNSKGPTISDRCHQNTIKKGIYTAKFECQQDWSPLALEDT
jgi:hypothetical protein